MKKVGARKPRVVQKGVGRNPDPKSKPPKVVQPEGKPEIPEPILAEAIMEIHKGFKRLRMSGLNRRGIVVLVRDASGVSMHDINAVLDALDSLADKYTRRG